MSDEITVHINVEANGKGVDARVSKTLLVGDFLHEKIVLAAAEAAAVAYEAHRNPSIASDAKIHRDHRR